MRRTISIQPEIFPLSTPFRISRGTKTAAEVVTVRIEQDGVAGRGECVPYPRYGETIDSTVAAIDAVRDALESGVGREELLRLMPAGAARNAVDCALWDLEARLAGSDVATMIGLKARSTLVPAETYVREFIPYGTPCEEACEPTTQRIDELEARLAQMHAELEKMRPAGSEPLPDLGPEPEPAPSRSRKRSGSHS